MEKFPSHITETVGHYASFEKWSGFSKDFLFENVMTGWSEVKPGHDSEISDFSNDDKKTVADPRFNIIPPQWNYLNRLSLDKNSLWGLQGVCLNTKRSGLGPEWGGAWPDLMPGEHCTIGHADDFFDEKLISISNFHLYRMKNSLSLDLIAQCHFCHDGFLKSITFIKMHGWKELTIQKNQTVSNYSDPALNHLSDAGSFAKISGWYEAILPDAHPMKKYFANSDIRFIFREKGEKFPTLGVMPTSDEILVKWLWLRAD